VFIRTMFCYLRRNCLKNVSDNLNDHNLIVPVTGKYLTIAGHLRSVIFVSIRIYSYSLVPLRNILFRFRDAFRFFVRKYKRAA